jgi:hypothetical protein
VVVVVQRPLEQPELPADQVVVVLTRVAHLLQGAVVQEQQAKVIMVVVELTAHWAAEPVAAEVLGPQDQVPQPPPIQMGPQAVLVYLAV